MCVFAHHAQQTDQRHHYVCMCLQMHSNRHNDTAARHTHDFICIHKIVACAKRKNLYVHTASRQSVRISMYAIGPTSCIFTQHVTFHSHYG